MSVDITHAWDRHQDGLKLKIVTNHYGESVVQLDGFTSDLGGETITTRLYFPREEFKEFLAACMLRVLTTGPDQDAETGPVEGECESDGRDYKAEAEAIWRSAMLGLPI